MTAYWDAPERTAPSGGPRPGTQRPGRVKPTRLLVVGRHIGTVVVTLHGDVDVPAAAGLASVLHDLIDGQGNLDVAVNLRAVYRIDNAGVQALFAAAKRIVARGGRLRVDGPSGFVVDALTRAGLAALIAVPVDRRPRQSSSAHLSSTAFQASMDAHPARNRWYRPV